VTGAAKKYSGKKWVMESNALGVDSVKLGFSGKGCRLTAEKGGKVYELDLGWERWVLNDRREAYVFGVKELYPMPSRMAGTATWTDDKTLQVNIRMVEAIFGDRVSFVFDGDRVAISFLNSVAETAIKKTEDPRKALEGKLQG